MIALHKRSNLRKSVVMEGDMQNWEFWVLVVMLVLIVSHMERRFDRIDRQISDLKDFFEERFGDDD